MGDATNDLVSRPDNTSFRMSHAYNKAGTFQLSIQATDADNRGDGNDVTSEIEADSKLDCFSYINIEDYRELEGEKPQIVSVQIGLLVRSTDSE